MNIQVMVARHCEDGLILGESCAWRVLSVDTNGVTPTGVTSSHRWQYQAILEGRKLAKVYQTELIIKGRNGKIRWRSSYGSDPKGRG